MKELKNDLLENVEINVMVTCTSMVYTLLNSSIVSSPLTFPAVQWLRGHEETAV